MKIKRYRIDALLFLQPALHAGIACQAELAQKSINQWVRDLLFRATHAD